MSVLTLAHNYPPREYDWLKIKKIILKTNIKSWGQENLDELRETHLIIEENTGQLFLLQANNPSRPMEVVCLGYPSNDVRGFMLKQLMPNIFSSLTISDIFFMLEKYEERKNQAFTLSFSLPEAFRGRDVIWRGTIEGRETVVRFLGKYYYTINQAYWDYIASICLYSEYYSF